MASFAIIDAPIDSSGTGRGEERAPEALRAAALVERLDAREAGRASAQIRDSRRDPDTGVVGAADLRRASEAIAGRVAESLEAGERPLVLGGDCSLLLGACAAIPRGSGLWFVDGHADFFDGESSPTGEAADMDLAILTGHGPPGLLEAPAPLIAPNDAVVLGHRPSDLDPDVAHENARLDPTIAALTGVEIGERGPGRVGAEATARLAGRSAWLHLDLDVLDQEVLPAVSYPQPLGLDWDELIELVRPLAAAPDLIGVSIADYNPDLDPDGGYAAQIVEGIGSIFDR